MLEGTIGHHTAPAVKNHDGLRARINLGIEVFRHRQGIDFQNTVHQVWAAVHQAFDQPVVVRASAFHHVAGQSPGTAREANEGHTAVQGLANGGDRVKHIAQFVHVGHLKGGNSRLIAHHFFKFGAFA